MHALLDDYLFEFFVEKTSKAQYEEISRTLFHLETKWAQQVALAVYQKVNLGFDYKTDSLLLKHIYNKILKLINYEA